jgi:hypothetical protein
MRESSRISKRKYCHYRKVEEIATETKTIATDAVETVSEKPVN